MNILTKFQSYLLKNKAIFLVLVIKSRKTCTSLFNKILKMQNSKMLQGFFEQFHQYIWSIQFQLLKRQNIRRKPHLAFWMVWKFEITSLHWLNYSLKQPKEKNVPQLKALFDRVLEKLEKVSCQSKITLFHAAKTASGSPYLSVLYMTEVA